MNVTGLIDASFNEAMKALVMGTSEGALARARERAFVKTLIARLQSAVAGEDLRVFASSRRGNESEFGTNHLLHDIVLCRIGKGKTAARKAEEFLYVAEALWQIEVDFSREWRPALYAINRLNCGAAAQKLLIASPDERSRERFLNSLRAPGAAGSGKLYLALIPHPADWEDPASQPQVWQLEDDGWTAAT